MKRFLTLIPASLLLWTAGCEAPPPAEGRNPAISLKTSEIAFLFDETGASKAKQVAVELTDLDDFTATPEYDGAEKDWLKISKEKDTHPDGSLKNHLAVIEALSTNTSVGAERTATITFAAEGATPQTLKVRQGFRGELMLSLSQDAISFKYDEANIQTPVGITTNATSLTATADADWIEAKTDLPGQKIILNLKSINKGEPRTANVVVTAESKTATIVVTQEAFQQTDFKLTPSTKTLTLMPQAAYRTSSFTATTTILPVTYRLDDAAQAWVEKVEYEEQPAKTGLFGERRTVKFTVTATENSTPDVRTGILTLITSYTNPYTHETVNTESDVALTQTTTPAIDIEGTWNWTAISAPINDDRTLNGDPNTPNISQAQKDSYVVKDGWVKATQNMSGTATIESVKGGYAIRGIRGVNLDYSLVQPAINVSWNNGSFYVGGVTSTRRELNPDAPGSTSTLNMLFDVAWLTGNSNQEFSKGLFNAKENTYVHPYIIEHPTIPPLEDPENPGHFIHQGEQAWTEHQSMLEFRRDRLDAGPYPITFTEVGGQQTLTFLASRQINDDIPGDGGKKERTFITTYIFYEYGMAGQGAEFLRNIVLTRQKPSQK